MHTRSSAIIFILPTALKSASKKLFLGPAYCQKKQEKRISMEDFTEKGKCNTMFINSMLTLQLPTSATFASILCTNTKLAKGNPCWHKADSFTVQIYAGMECPYVFCLPEGTAQKPASPRKWSIRNSSYKSRARLILFIHHEKPSASIAFQSYNGLQNCNR